MGDVSDNYGRKVGMALKAVRQLHADSSRLLTDCDGSIGKGKSLATRSNNATNGISYSLGRPWMAEGAYRCYAAEPDKQPGLVDAICLGFLGEETATDEPILIVGQACYLLEAGQKLPDLCEGWDLWWLFADYCSGQAYGKVLSSSAYTYQDGSKSFDWFKLLAVPLYSINSMVDVVAMMDRVRGTEIPPTVSAAPS